MKPSVIYEWLPIWYESKKPFYIRSAPGRGKSTLIGEAPKRIGALLGKNLGFVWFNGANANPMDLLGYGVPRHEEGKPTIMTFSLPFLWKTAEGKFLHEYDGGIILIEEADKMDVDMKKIIADSALVGRFGIHQLPPGWVVWFAGNRAEDRSGSTKELDHMINRITYIDWTDDPKGWEEDYAIRTNRLKVTIAFAMAHTGLVWSDKLPDKQRPYCTPRSTCAWDDILQTTIRYRGGTIEDGEIIGEFPMDEGMQEICAGTMGHPEAAQYFETLMLSRDMPKYHDIVANPTGVKVPERTDAQMLVCYNLAKLVEKKDAASVIRYVDRMPKELSITFAKRAIDRDHKLMSDTTFARWAMANSQLLTFINGLTA